MSKIWMADHIEFVALRKQVFRSFFSDVCHDDRIDAKSLEIV